MLSRLIHESWRDLISERNQFAHYSDISSYFTDLNRFSCHFERLLRAGADINHVLVVREAGFVNLGLYPYRERYFRELKHYDLLDYWCEQRNYCTNKNNDSLNILQYIQLLLRNGLAFFYGNVNKNTIEFGNNILWSSVSGCLKCLSSLMRIAAFALHISFWHSATRGASCIRALCPFSTNISIGLVSYSTTTRMMNVRAI